MKVLAITGNPKGKGALETLTEEVMRGAVQAGAEVELIRLADRDIGYCRFCMKYREDPEAPIAPCSQKDDTDDILEKIREADGLIMACPVSSAHANAIMKTFIERTCWRLWRPPKNALKYIGWQESRIKDRQRYLVTITTAGGIPTFLRFFINGSTREMSSLARHNMNAKVSGRLYSGPLFHRGLRDGEKGLAFELGHTLVEAVKRRDSEHPIEKPSAYSY